MQTLVPYRRRSMAHALRPFVRFEQSSLMATDIEKTETGLDFTVSLPGYAKENVELELKDGYLKVTASTSSSQEEEKDTDNGGHYIRRERFAGTCRRAFYVGEDVDEEAIKAKFEDGVLKVNVPFVQAEETPEEKKLIEIEG